MEILAAFVWWGGGLIAVGLLVALGHIVTRIVQMNWWKE